MLINSLRRSDATWRQRSCSWTFGNNVDWFSLKIGRQKTKCIFYKYAYENACQHYNDVTMGAMASQITSLTIVYSTVYSGADQRQHQSSASLVFVRVIHRWPVNSPHKGLVTRKMFSFDDAIVKGGQFGLLVIHSKRIKWKQLSTPFGQRYIATQHLC